MSLQDDLIAAQANLVAAQNVEDNAEAAVADIQAKIDAVQPHISLWQRVQDTAVKYGDEAKAEFDALANEARNILNI